MTTVLSPHRTGRITGSRVAAVLGIDPYRAAADVTREMVRDALGALPEFTGNYATRWGNEHEARAIADYERSQMVEVYERQIFYIHDDLPFLGVTPDGFFNDDRGAGLLEVKAPISARYTNISERPDYAAQVQLQLAVTGREFADFLVWRPDGSAISQVESDPWWIDAHQETLQAFIDEYQKIIADPELAAPYLADRTLERTDDDWIARAAEILEIRAAKVALDEAEKAATDDLIRMHQAEPDLPTKGGGVTLVHSTREGSVSYSKAVKALAPDADLSTFRGQPTEVWSVRKSSVA